MTAFSDGQFVLPCSFAYVVNTFQPRSVNLVGPSSFGLLQPQVRWEKGCNYKPGWEMVGIGWMPKPVNLQRGIGYMDMRLQPTKHSPPGVLWIGWWMSLAPTLGYKKSESAEGPDETGSSAVIVFNVLFGHALLAQLQHSQRDN